MNLAKLAIEKKAVTYFSIFLLVVGGVLSYFQLGQLEDPDFTIKTAVVLTPYPGASPQEVELEVTDRIELALQELKQVDYIESFSRAGYSQIKVEIKSIFGSAEIPQIWDELRRKVSDVASQLPPGAGPSVVNDDFGDVFGHLLAVTGEGFSYGELESYVEELKRELSLVDGVARIDLWGNQDKVVYIDVSETQLSQLGLSEESIEQTLQAQNAVVDAGWTDVQNRRLRIAPTGEFASPADIAELPIRPTLFDTLQSGDNSDGFGASSELIRIGDIGDVRPGYQDPPSTLMRYNGQPAIVLAIANLPGVNVVDMGKGVSQRLDELIVNLPIGIEPHRVHWQSDVIEESVNGFFISLLQAIAIVLAVLAIAMGWRMGVIIGTALILTILATFIMMGLFSIDLQRMSLGALVIALGMMVDNAIVVAEGVVVRLEKGMDKIEAAIESAQQPSMPLLGATVIAVMAFYPIVASTENSGEYCATLFSVVAIALLASWLISVTVTPLQCTAMLKVPKPTDGEKKDPYGGRFYRAFAGVLKGAIRVRYLTVAVMVGLLVLAGIGFQGVPKLFFPDSSMPKFMIDYWSPEGNRIEDVAADLERIEARLLADERVDSVSAFIGAGPPRFYLPVDPESANPAYAQLVVNVHDFRDINAILDELDPWLESDFPEAQIPLRKFAVGPANTWKFQTRISGGAVADPDVLRSLASQGLVVLEENSLAGASQSDWRQRVLKIEPAYNIERARWSGVTRDDIARATRRAFDGRTIGLYREQDDLIPIVLRQVEAERQNVGGLDVLQIQPAQSTVAVPLSQVVDGIDIRWEDPVIQRRDRKRTITVQSNPVLGTTLPTLFETVQTQFEDIELPRGYTMEWGGEHEDSAKSQAALIPGMIPAFIIMLFTTVALFNAFRPLLIIFLTVPFAAIGISAGLLVTQTAFGFVALLGAMSLSGMMIKNAIVLLDEINLNLSNGMDRYNAVIVGAQSRLRPVVLAAATTVLGVIPLLQDVFWIGLAVTIMAGLAFGTVLTMVLFPVFYAIFYRVKPAPAA